MGMSSRAARGSAMSGKGAWRLSRTSAVQRALTIEYLTEAGLFNLESYWEQSVCILKTNRLVRTRMLGGVGGVQHEPAPIPIRVVIPRLRARS